MDQILIDIAWHWVKPLNQKMADADMLAEFNCQWVDAEWLALFIETCKLWPDTDEDYPGGKWAGIQLLQQRLETGIRAEITRVHDDQE